MGLRFRERRGAGIPGGRLWSRPELVVVLLTTHEQQLDSRCIWRIEQAGCAELMD